MTKKNVLNMVLNGTCDGEDWTSGFFPGSLWYLYQETGEEQFKRLAEKFASYLEQADRIGRFIINHPNLPDDKIPYWDFNAPNIPNTYKDASAGAIIYIEAMLRFKYIFFKILTYFYFAKLGT